LRLTLFIFLFISALQAQTSYEKGQALTDYGDAGL